MDQPIEVLVGGGDIGIDEAEGLGVSLGGFAAVEIEQGA